MRHLRVCCRIKVSYTKVINMENVSKSEFKKTRLDQAIHKKKMTKIFWIVGVSTALLFLIGGGVWYSRKHSKNLPGVYYPPVGQEHIPLNAASPKPYNSNPPSSGGHFERPANWSVYDYEVNDQIFIHNLEHGGVWIAYKPSVPPKVVDDLKAIVNEFGGSKFVMAPRSANDTDVAMVAWSRVLKFNVLGESLSDTEKEEIRSFYKAFKNKGPEFVPDTMPGIDPKSLSK